MKRTTLILLVILISCDGRNQENISKNNCPEKIKFNRLIKEVIDIPELQTYFNVLKVIDQKQLVILKDNNFSYTIELKKFDLPVKFLTEKEIASHNIKAYIIFKEIQIQGDSANVYFRFDIQGIGCKAKYFLSNCIWKADTIHIWEN